MITMCLIADDQADNLAIQGWEYLINNEYEQSIRTFDQVLEIDPGNSDAHLGKIYFYNIMEDYTNSLDEFEELYTNNQDYLNENLKYLSLMIYTSGKNNKLNKLQKNILKSKSLNYTNELVIKNWEALYNQKIGKLSKAKKIIKDMHPIYNWKLIGPFDNVLGSGFDEVYEPENKFTGYNSITGKNNILLNWFSNTHNPYHPWVDLNDVFDFDDAVYYANTFVYSYQNQEVIIHFGVSGMTCLYLNDVLIASETEEERDCNLDQFVIKTHLKPGWNRLLIKIGKSEEPDCNFFININDINNQPIQNLEISSEQQEYSPDRDLEFEILGDPVIAKLKDNIEKHPQDLINYLNIAAIYKTNDYLDSAESYLKKACEIAPESSLAKSMLMKVYLINDKQEEGQTIIDNLFVTDEKLPVPVNYQIKKELDNKNYELVKEYLTKLENISGKSADWYLQSILLNIGLEQTERYLSLLEEGLQFYPDDVQLVNLKLLHLYKRKKLNDAYYLYKDYTSDHYTQENLYLMAILAMERQDAVSFYKYKNKQFELNPADSNVRYEYANLYYESLHAYQEAMTILNETVSINPTAHYIYKLYGDCYRALKGITKFSELSGEEAERLKEYYLKALKYEPLNYSVRRQLRELEGEEPIFSLFDEFDYKSMISDEIDLESYPDKHSVIIKDHKNIVTYSNGGSESESFTFIKILKESGVKEFQELQFSAKYYEKKFIEEAKVVKTDGSEIDAEINNGTVVFKKLEPNDYIYYKIRIESYLTDKFKNHFFDSYPFNGTLPVLESKYTIIMPKNTEFDYFTKNFSLSPDTVEVADFFKYTWAVSEAEIIETEYAMPEISFVNERLELSTIDSWGYIVDWYLNLTTKRSKASVEIEEIAAGLIAGKDDLTLMDKVQLVYEYITEEINYSYVSFRQSRHIPQKAKRVLSTGIGDCKDVACLSISMLNELGINAHYVLLNTDSKNPENTYLPSIDVFNHVITAVEVGDSLFYMDLTAQYFPFGTLPDQDVNSFALLVKPGIEEPFIMQKNDIYPNKTSYVSNITIDLENNSLNQVNLVWEGLNAGYIRSAYRDMSEKDRIKKVKESLSDDAINVTLDSLKFENLDNLKPLIYENYTYTSDNILLDSGSFKILTPPWLSSYTSSSALSYDTRNYPIKSWARSSRQTEQLNITIEDKHLKLMELPEDVVIDSKFGQYTQKYSLKNGILKAEKYVIVKQTWVKPEEYIEFKDFYNKLILADKRQLLYKINQ